MSRRAHQSVRPAPLRDSGISTEQQRVAGARREGAIREHEVIVEPARIRRIIWRLFADEAGGILRTSGARYPHRPLRIARVQPARQLPLAFEVVGGLAGAEIAIQLHGPGSVYEFSPEHQMFSAGLLATSMPRVLVRQRRRHSRRVRVAAVRVTFAHPEHPRERIEREVLDVSREGLAIRVGRFDGLFEGAPMEVIVDWQERGRMRLSGVVRHVSSDLDGTGEIAGIELALDENEDVARWRRHVEGLLWPATIADGKYARDVWECLVDSGYCSLSDKSVEDFEDLRQAFVGATRAIAASPDIGAQLVIPSGRGVEATLSTARIYDRSHFLFGVAKQPGRTPSWTNGRRILRDLYVHAIERISADPCAAWLIVWVQAQAELTRLVHHEMAKRYAVHGRAALFRVDVMEARPSIPAPIPSNVTLAGAEDVREVLARLRTQRSPIYLDALDLVPDRFELHDVQRAWASAGLARERAAFVARDPQGAIVAAAICEMASEGVHLFRLLDAVRTYVLRDGGEAEISGLLAAARRFFEDRRKPTFVYVREDLRTAPPEGFRSLALTDVTIFPSSLYPELLEHVHDLTAPAEPPPR